MTRVESVPPAVLAAGRAAVKAHLRLESTIEDALIDGQVGAAIGAFEAYAGLLAIARNVTATAAAGSGWIRLSAVPVVSIVAVESAADEGSVPVSYRLNIDPDGSGWISHQTDGQVRVQYRAGLAEDWSGLPDAARHGIVRLAAHLFTHRDRIDDAPPAAVAALWRPCKRLRLR